MTFEDYVADHGQSLLRLAVVLSGDPHRAEDLTQTVLAKAYRRWRRIEAVAAPDAYVRKMLVNAFVSWRRLKSSGEVAVHDVPERRGAADPDPADAVAAFDETRQLLAGLPRQARAVLVLRYYADLDDAAIASALGITQSTVRSTASRALASLRTVLVSPREAS